VLRDHLNLIAKTTQVLIDHVEELTVLDQAIGDGDHGLNMKRGAQAIQAKLASFEGKPFNETLKLMGMTCMSTIGGSSGPVFGTLLVTLAKELPEQPTRADFERALDAAIAALMKLGKVEVGQKTLLDVLAPVQHTIANHPRDADIRELIGVVRQCAIDSANATAQMQAIKGRASFLGDRALGHIDPGSRSMSLIICAICDHF
jgi:phosphoenolpyruvate---glycerone phosphotransferase subunit DhaL